MKVTQSYKEEKSLEKDDNTVYPYMNRKARRAWIKANKKTLKERGLVA